MSFCFEFQLQSFLAKQGQRPRDPAAGQSQATSATNDSMCSLVELWGMTNNDTHQVWWGQWAMRSGMQQLVSVIKTTTCPAICRVKHTGQHPFCYEERPCLHQLEISWGSDSSGAGHWNPTSLQSFTATFSESTQHIIAWSRHAVCTNQQSKNRHTSAKLKARVCPLKADTIKQS